MRTPGGRWGRPAVAVNPLDLLTWWKAGKAVCRSPCLVALGDFRDLTSRELAHLEQVSVRTPEDWAERGDGPPFRKAGRKTSRRRYPLGGYLDWRERTTMTSTIERHRNAG